MSFQDELNNLKMPQRNSVFDVNKAVSDAEKCIIERIKYEAHYCTIGDKLNCNFFLECSSLFNYQSLSCRGESFFHKGRNKCNVTMKPEMGAFRSALILALQKYKIHISGLIAVPLYLDRDSDTGTYRDTIGILTAMGKLYFSYNEETIQYCLTNRFAFDPSKPFSQTTYSSGFSSHYDIIEQNGLKIDTGRGAALALLISYRE